MKIDKKISKEIPKQYITYWIWIWIRWSKVWMDHISYVDSVELDNYGTSYAIMGNSKSNLK
jgi:hypothetical protein